MGRGDNMGSFKGSKEEGFSCIRLGMCCYSYSNC